MNTSTRDALAGIKLQPKPSLFNADAIRRFGQIKRANITADPITFRKAYIKSVVGRIEIDDHAIRIIEDKEILEQVLAGDHAAGPNVSSFVRKWRARRDSNS